jgi:hypothetical protein
MPISFCESPDYANETILCQILAASGQVAGFHNDQTPQSCAGNNPDFRRITDAPGLPLTQTVRGL